MQLGLGLSLPNIATQGISLPRRIAAIFRKPNLEAHLYMPGPEVPVLGPELVVNGGFDTGISGWSAGNGSGIQWSSGALRVTRLVVGNTWPNSRQTLTGLLPGRAYAISSKVSNPSGLDAYQSILGKPSAEARSTLISTTLNSQFVADSTTHSVDVGLYGATGAVGQYVDFESVSVREILGYTNKIDGFTTGNYLESTGNTNASVDGAVGLVLDAAGSVGAELVVNGGFDADTGWTKLAGTTISGGAATYAGAATNNDIVSQQISVVAGKSYLVEHHIDSITGAASVGLGSVLGVFYTTAGIKRDFITATTTGVVTLKVAGRGAGCSQISINSLSVRELPGIHATQATTANKPTLRRGIVNLLTYSNDLTNAAWSKGTGVNVNNGVVSGASGTAWGGAVIQRQSSVLSSSTAYTGVMRLRSAGATTCQITLRDQSTGAVSSQTLALSSAWQYVVVYRTTGASTTGLGLVLGGADGDVEFGGAGVFQGTLTAQQILDAGGIPVTTSAPASSAKGVNYLEFDGVDDRLQLSAVPFQMADDHCVVAVVKLNAKTAGSQRIMHTGSGGDIPRVACIGFTSNGYADVNWRDDAGSYQSISGSVDLTGQVVVITARKIGNVKQLRVNGVQVGADNTVPLGVTTVTASNIGRHTADGAYFNGNIYVILPLKGAFSDADVKMIEKFAAQLAQVQL